MLLNECPKLVHDIQDVLNLMLSSGYTPLDKVNRWRNQCVLCLKTVRKEQRCVPPLATNQKRKCQNIIENLECLKACFDLLAKTVSGTTSKRSKRNDISERVQWIDVKKAFKSRVKACIVVNLVHKEVLVFLEDAAVLFVAQVGKVLLEHKAFKINALLGFEILNALDLKLERINQKRNSSGLSFPISNPKMKRSTSLRL